MNRRTLLLFALLGAAALATGALIARLLSSPSITLQAGTWLPEPRALPQFHLRDLSGRDFSLEQLRGHPTLLFFGFTSCPDVCPTTLALLSELQRSAPLPGTQVLFVSIDPERDSASQMRVYLDAFSPQFLGARGDTLALAPLERALGVLAVRQNLPGGGYTMDHSATLYLLDRRARWVAVFSPPFSIATLRDDLHRIGAAHAL
jgi:protein SCO1/2